MPPCSGYEYPDDAAERLPNIIVRHQSVYLNFHALRIYMPGFTISYQPPSVTAATAGSCTPNIENLGIDVSHSDVDCFTTEQNHLVLIDGYTLGVSAERLAAALESQDDKFLSNIHGHFCAVLIYADGNIWGFCDRFGGKTLYWQSTNKGSIVITSRWENMPVFDRRWDELGLGECLRYRWLSGQESLLKNISKLPLWHRVFFANDGEITIHTAAQRPKSVTGSAKLSFDEKLDETRNALSGTISEIAGFYNNAAVFLSGGVDSSLLAALAKPCFEKCLLVTPVFSGDDNPELDNAKAFAKTLQLEHLLVDIDETRIERDLHELSAIHCGQITFQQLAVHQMMEAIPDEYQLLIHGELADFAFGSNKFRRIETDLRRKRFANLLPNFAAKILTKLPIRKVRHFCKLRLSSVADLTLQFSRIQYDSSSMEIVQSINNANLDELSTHQAAIQFQSGTDAKLPALLREIARRGVNASRFKELDASATWFGKRIFVPFSAESVGSASLSLTREQFFGKDYVKPVLRELACEHYARELIYQKKQGFEVPFRSWLKGPLAHLVTAAKQESELFDGKLLENLDIDEHFSIFWTLICWQVIDKNLRLRQMSAPTKASALVADPSISS